MRKFETKEIGGSMVFWNEDQSISGEVYRSNVDIHVSTDRNSGDITEGEMFNLIELYMQSSAAKR